MPLGQLVIGITPGAIYFTPALNRGALGDLVRPTDNVRIFLDLQKLTRFIELPFGQGAIPGPDGHIGDAVFLTGQIRVVSQALVQHIHLALDFHGKAVDRIFHFARCIGIKMAETAAQKWRTTHLPKQPGHAFGLRDKVLGHECVKFLGQVPQDGCRLEDPHGLGSAAVQEGGNFGVGVDADKLAAKLLAFLDVDEPGVIFGAAVAQCQQFFEHHGNFDAVGRAQ